MTGEMDRRPGRERAFLALIAAVESELRGYVRRRVWSEDWSQNIVQQTYLLAWSSARFDPEDPRARGWLFTTARRLIIVWRKSGDTTVISLDDLGNPVDTTDRDPVIKLIEEERHRHLDTALARLRPDKREVLVRYYLDQEGTQAEIAKKMALTVAALNSRLNDARSELKREIKRLRGYNGSNGAGYDL